MTTPPTPPESDPPTPAKSSFPHRFLPSPPASSISSTTRPTPHPTSQSYTHALLSYTDSFVSSLSSLSAPPLVSAARYAILAMMQHSIAHGQLRIVEINGTEHVYPSAEKRRELRLADEAREEDKVEIRVLRDTFWLRLVSLGDLGFAEAFMAGDCEVSDLVTVFKIFIRSRPALQASASTSSAINPVSTLPSKLFSLITSLTNSRFANTLSNSVSNIRAHYDLSNGMFAAFLSRDMTYSCGIFKELDADLKGGGNKGKLLKRLKEVTDNGKADDGEDSLEVDELEESQLTKIRHMIRKADIRPGHRVLEIGSGWGSFAIEAVRLTQCTVDTLTLSSQQKALAEERIKAAGFAGRIRVWLMDYRSLPKSWLGQFDRVVSIEMLEAVGKEFIPGYFSVIDQALKPNTGAATIQVITIPESRFETYQKEVDFIRKWIFPGGFLPTVSYVVDSVRTGASNRLVVDSISNIGPHYARTLREWQRRFLDTFDSHIAPALLAEHEEMDEDDVQVFKRKWLYYFSYCEVGFAERVIGDHIITLVREGYGDYGCTTYD